MIFDQRTYIIKPKRLSRFLETYERLAQPLHSKYLGETYRFSVSQAGPFNQVVHIWQFDSMADRAQRREAMKADPQWRTYRHAAAEDDALINMENHVLTAVNLFQPR